MRKKWSREAFEKKFGSVEWSQNKNTPEAKEYERMSLQYSDIYGNTKWHPSAAIFLF